MKPFSSAFIYLLIKLQSLYFKQVPRSITKDNTYCGRAATIVATEIGMELLYNFDCILNLRKNELFCGAIGKTLQLSPSQRSNKNLFLIAAEDHELPRRCEGFIKCKINDEKANITQQTEIIVEPIKGFEDKSHLLIARSLNDMVDVVVWVQALNPTLESKKVYRNARIACAENIEKISRVQ